MLALDPASQLPPTPSPLDLSVPKVSDCAGHGLHESYMLAASTLASTIFKNVVRVCLVDF